jgi:hypothetical protein
MSFARRRQRMGNQNINWLGRLGIAPAQNGVLDSIRVDFGIANYSAYAAPHFLFCFFFGGRLCLMWARLV